MERKMYTGLWWRYLEDRDRLEGLSVNRITLKFIFKTKNRKAWTGLIWLRIRDS
jgi:hypothetical protein